MIVPGLILALVVLHFLLVKRHRISPTRPCERMPAVSKQTRTNRLSLSLTICGASRPSG